MMRCIASLEEASKFLNKASYITPNLEILKGNVQVITINQMISKR